MKLMKPLFNPEYWDCECEENYIHKQPRNYCPKCGAVEGDHPGSWVHEVEIMYDASKDSALVLSRKILRQIQIKGIHGK